jgi:predicted acyltransferase
MSQAGRLESVDVFRGLTMASMVMVNNAGDWNNVYGPLRHASWHGWTFTDMVFPFFLWIVGVAMTLSTAKRVERGEDRGTLIRHAFLRAGIIFGIGLLLNGFPYYNLSTLRIPGVLQRIAVCYLVATLIFLHTSWRGQVVAILACFASYWAMMHSWGYDKGSTFAQHVDGLFLGGHMYSATKTWDPEGIVSTLPAVATALFGILCGHLLRSRWEAAEKSAWMMTAGAGLTFVGLALDYFQPINKQLWTVPYALLMAGLAFTVFGCCHWLIDVRGHRGWWTKWFAVYGMNAMAVYILSGVLSRTLSLTGVRAPLYQAAFAPWRARSTRRYCGRWPMSRCAGRRRG